MGFESKSSIVAVTVVDDTDRVIVKLKLKSTVIISLAETEDTFVLGGKYVELRVYLVEVIYEDESTGM
jgi:hypothetical protein